MKTRTTKLGRTAQDLLRAAVSRLRTAGVDTPGADARRLMQAVTGWSPADLIGHETDPLPHHIATRFEDDIRRREAREPLAYITGEVDFFGLVLKSDSRALVPRADSECVVQLALDWLPEDDRVEIADLGTGSGCLLLALLSQRPMARGIGVDMSGEALSLARENADLTQLTPRCRFEKTDIVHWSCPTSTRLIISNPPYISGDSLLDTSPEVRVHEPRLALYGGDDGLDAYRLIADHIVPQLPHGCMLVLEIGYDQKAAVTALLEQAGMEILETRQDLAGHDRAIASKKI